MGGYNSSRWGSHARRRTVEEAAGALTVSSVRPLIDAGAGKTWRLAWSGGVLFVLTFRDDEGEEGTVGPRLELGKGSRAIGLEQAAQPFGGARWWLLCPDCGQRRGALYLAARRALWPLCRECLGLGYTSQRSAPQARLLEQRNALAERLGVEHWGEWPERPKGMRRKRYAHEAEQLATLEAGLDADIVGRGLKRLLGRGER